MTLQVYPWRVCDPLREGKDTQSPGNVSKSFPRSEKGVKCTYVSMDQMT